MTLTCRCNDALNRNSRLTFRIRHHVAGSFATRTTIRNKAVDYR